nr:12077_t:CDS:2 [Entrophospora candida]
MSQQQQTLSEQLPQQSQLQQNYYDNGEFEHSQMLQKQIQETQQTQTQSLPPLQLVYVNSNSNTSPLLSINNDISNVHFNNHDLNLNVSSFNPRNNNEEDSLIAAISHHITTALVPDDNNMMSLITTTPLLNDTPSSFSCKNNNNIVWILSRLEKRIDQIETSRNQRTLQNKRLGTSLAD